MKKQTESVIRNILSMDAGICESQINAAIAILNHREEPEVELVSVLKVREVAKLLNTSRETVHRYAHAGLLDKIYGAGFIMLGISRTSFIRFSEDRSRQISGSHEATATPESTHLDDNKREREIVRRKIAWALRKVSKASNPEKYEALISYCDTHKGIPFSVGCDALNIAPKHFANYRKRRHHVLAKKDFLRERVLNTLQALHPNKHQPIVVATLQTNLARRRIHIGAKRLNRIIEKNGYKRLTRQRHIAKEPQPMAWYHAEDFVECS